MTRVYRTALCTFPFLQLQRCALAGSGWVLDRRRRGCSSSSSRPASRPIRVSPEAASRHARAQHTRVVPPSPFVFHERCCRPRRPLLPPQSTPPAVERVRPTAWATRPRLPRGRATPGTGNGILSPLGLGLGRVPAACRR
jgi:hypothetical protein